MKPPYEITNTILSLYGKITEALGLCKSLMLVRPEARLRKQNRIKTIHSSLAIEGNTLNLEHVTALIENVRVLGPEKDIREVQNAIKAYDQISHFNPYSVDDFLRAHQILMGNLVSTPGEFRKKQVGIMRGSEVQHVAPGFQMVPGLMNDLFTYIKNDSDMDIIKSCVFHYETEFIHPFEDGNGRMGRFWQTRLLMGVNPIFEYVPIEETIKNDQDKYYKVLAEADNSGKSTLFIEFMLDTINQALRKTLDDSKPGKIDYRKRTKFSLPLLSGWFDRKDYMRLNKGISPATASRDLRQLLDEGKIISSGQARMTKYKRAD